MWLQAGWRQPAGGNLLQAELDSRWLSRKLKWKNQVELNLDAPDTFRIEPYSIGGAHITGGDLRGFDVRTASKRLDQIRATGHFTKTSATRRRRYAGFASY